MGMNTGQDVARQWDKIVEEKSKLLLNADGLCALIPLSATVPMLFIV
jgi:hypothetical protein